jgi:hypothetical protein
MLERCVCQTMLIKRKIVSFQERKYYFFLQLRRSADLRYPGVIKKAPNTLYGTLRVS